MLYGKDHSFAFISPQGRLNEYSIYQMGDCFNPQTVRRDKECKEDSVQVIKIGDRRGVILHRGKKQALWMLEARGFKVKASSSKSQSAAKSSALIVPPAETPKAAQKKKIQAHISVAKTILEQQRNTVTIGFQSFPLGLTLILVIQRVKNYASV